MTWPFIPSVQPTTSVSNTGPVSGVRPPKVMPGAAIAPHYAYAAAGTVPSANDLYYVPIYVPDATTWAGIKCQNGSAGDTGEVIRFGIYQEATNGGPGSLLADLGTITLDASAAQRTLASSWTSTSIGWHYSAVHFQSATNLIFGTVQATDSSVGRYPINAGSGMPQITLSFSYTGVGPFLLVNTAYGALASTAVTPTSSATFGPFVFIYR